MPRNDPTYQPITAEDGWFRAEDQSVQWTIYQASGAVQDITGFTLEFKMSATKGGTASLTKSVTLTTPASGICTAAFLAADTAALAAGTYWYTMRRTDSGSNRVLAWGPALLQAGPL